MKRGEISTAAAGSGYAGKPRPVVIVQDDLFVGTASVTICAFTTDPTDAPSSAFWWRRKLIERVGQLSAPDMTRLDQSIAVFLGLASR